MKNWTFYRSLHSRRMTVAQLAAQIGSGRAHVTQVLNNKPGRGLETRTKLFRVLTYEEIRALGWWNDFLIWLRKDVPRGTKFQ
jgi:transcriptional regulator with XRE-family HTH domain